MDMDIPAHGREDRGGGGIHIDRVDIAPVAAQCSVEWPSLQQTA